MTPHGKCEYNMLLELLHGTPITNEQEIPREGCWIMPAAIYQRVQELKRLQRQFTDLQISNASLRESVGIQALDRLKRKLLRRPPPPDEIRELSERISQETITLRQLVGPIEMSDAYFPQYQPCGDDYIRIPAEMLRELARHFFELSVTSHPENPLERFSAIREIFRNYPPDPRILGFIAILAASHRDFDAEGFFTWDERLLRMIFGKEATPSHPLTYDRFLIHAVLYGLPAGEIADRYIGFRIGWDLFRDDWARHFRHQLRALATAGQLLRHSEAFPKDESSFKDFYRRKLARYRALMQSIHHRAKATDSQMGRGVSISGQDMNFGPVQAGSGNMASVFDGLSLAPEARLGIPDPVFIAVSRLVGLPLAVDAVHRHFTELLQTFEVLDDPAPVAGILADTPLYFMDRQDEKRSFESDEPGAFARQLRERYQGLKNQKSSLPLTPVHTALIVLHPGPVLDALRGVEDVFQRLDGLPDTARRLTSFLLMDGAIPMVQHRRFTYELWFSEGLG